MNGFELIERSSLSPDDGWKLMRIYEAGNRETAEELYPDMDADEGLKKVERDFLDYLDSDFFSESENYYQILSYKGEWVSAVRLYGLGGGLYYLEALETKGEARQHGFAVKLLDMVTEKLKKRGPFRLCDCVHKENVPSIETHLKAGFHIAGDGYDCLRNETKDWEYGFEYEWKEMK
ncbi:MAG: GNAT family N-acetyltransferase [Clostridia bacterium]|nr:GNAT family N-acetyltransferase [Clostridia bacterium]